MNTYGGLVVILPNGCQASAFWDVEMVPVWFRPAVSVLAQRVQRAAVVGVFVSSDTSWGHAHNKSKVKPGGWSHMAVRPEATRTHKSPIKSADVVMAERREEYGMLCRGLAAFTPAVIEDARTILAADVLYRSESCLGVAKWLSELHTSRNATSSKRYRDNITWLAVATAPVGFCHVKSTMIGALLEDLAAGKPFDAVAASFKAKMHPLQYKRPTAVLSDGNIAQAEKTIDAMGLRSALKRRFARLEDVLPHAAWSPQAASGPTVPPAPGGVFSHLKSKAAAHVPASANLPMVTMTWVRFARDVLPGAERVEYHVDNEPTGYGALVTAADPDAKPIVLWDYAEKRNPVTWYFYNGGSAPQDWNLRAGSWVEVTAFVPKPTMWDAERTYSNERVGMWALLRGARDMRTARGSFFPSQLKSELHGIRATLEAYARNAVVDDAAEATACGICVSHDEATAAPAKHTFRVIKKGVTTTVRIDRWE